MAGIKKGVFPEKITPFLKEKLSFLKKTKGQNSPEYRAIYLQYVASGLESLRQDENNKRHWVADMEIITEKHKLRGVERLYHHSLVIEPTMICAAHCRYCLRGNYDIFTLEEEELKQIARYCGEHPRRDEIREVLITGGDPLIIPKRLDYLIEALTEHASNIKVVRIGTRLPQHAPERIDNNVFRIFSRYRSAIRFEIATQINHEAEIFPEVEEKFLRFREMGIKIYSQNVLLKNVNDDRETLIRLYNRMRDLDMESHYLFHCVPMKGMHHFRTSVRKGLDLAKDLVNSGHVSGRAKPMFALMTDIGKITLYDGVILKRKGNRVFLQSSYRYDERKKWNPGWQLPESAVIDKNGFMRVWYLDGEG